MADYAPKGRLAVAELIVGRSISGDGAPEAGIPVDEKGAPDGVATLDENGRVPAGQVPAANQADAGGVKQMAPIADLTDAPTQQDFNDLLAALRDAGILATS